MNEIIIIPFWSYYEWLNGNRELGKEIILNIGLFIPLGFIFCHALGKEWKIKVLIFGMLFSVIVEVFQYIYKLGCAEFDDVISNTIGFFLGMCLFSICEKIIKQYTIFIYILFVSGGIYLIYDNIDSFSVNQQSQFAFYIQKIENEEIFGYAFPYGVDSGNIDYSIVLSNLDTGENTKLKTVCNIKNEEINKYYDSDKDYSLSGFIATIDDELTNAEILIDWESYGIRKTGLFLINGRIKCSSLSEFDFSNTDIKIIEENGFFIAYNPDNHCQIYQMDNKLYWIVDDDFYFEDDGTTYIEYQLWTSNVNKLPEDRKKYGFDNLGFVFENYEITESMCCNNYRVAVRDIPEDYPITYIKIGYYANDSWIWSEYFRLR